MFQDEHRRIFSDIVKAFGNGSPKLNEFEAPHEVRLPALARGHAKHCRLNEFMCVTVGRTSFTLGVEWRRTHFGSKVGTWLGNPPLENRKDRLRGICAKLEVDYRKVHHLRYKLLCLAYAVLHEASRFGCNSAALVIQARPNARRHFEDFISFLAAVEKSEDISVVTLAGGKELLLTWVDRN